MEVNQQQQQQQQGSGNYQNPKLQPWEMTTLTKKCHSARSFLKSCLLHTAFFRIHLPLPPRLCIVEREQGIMGTVQQGRPRG